uniref:NXPE C-terminal domain-containing protein n=1 Tax=Leptobrachium leishanense TaxID=445787 RepID=A0A8C5QN77_9ANUR
FWERNFSFFFKFYFIIHRTLYINSRHFQAVLFFAKSPYIAVPNRSYVAKEYDLEVVEIFHTVNQSISNVPFTSLNETTSGKNSRAIILDYKEKYFIGDYLTVRVDTFDYMGKEKTYGGDFLRARIFSQYLGAGASGRIEDFNNGSYNIYFALSWEGNVKISISLYHPSEGVSVLWKTRNIGYDNIIFTGKFINNSREIHRECGFYLVSKENRCEYFDPRHGEVFYCIKPPDVPCEALISMMSDAKPHSYLSDMEKTIFTRFIAVDSFPNFVFISSFPHVSGNSTEVMTKCRFGMLPPFPSGYFLQNIWHAFFCNLSSYEPLSQIDKCLTGKMIYLMGDSTLRQWIEYFPSRLKNLKYFDLHESGWHKRYLAIDMNRNIFIQWKKHGHPFVTRSFYNVKDYTTITNEIDQLSGGPHTVIVITVGQHFRPFPLIVFIKRLLNVRKAIERLFLRSPDTNVIIKSENTREINTDVERFSDFHGYIQYMLVKDIFKGLNVGVIDAWDMTIASGSYNVHPSNIVIENEINMLLAYIC